jgi:VanZ family protein
MLKKAYLPAIGWLLLVTILSVISGVPAPKFNLFSIDKIGHAGAYAVLTWLLFYGFKKANGRMADRKESAVIFCIAAGYGVCMEFIQGAFFPSRFFEVDDMYANAFGAFVATLLAQLWFLRKVPTSNQTSN